MRRNSSIVTEIPFSVDPLRLPKETIHLFEAEDILRYGLLPLGLGTERGFFRSYQVLNVGLVDPAREDAIALIHAVLWALKRTPSHPFKKVLEQVQGVRIYPISPEELIRTLISVYGLNPNHVSWKDSSTVEPTLWRIVKARAKSLDELNSVPLLDLVAA
jgi:hypothetical protein